MNMPKPQRPSKNSQIAAGPHTNADPPTGSMESKAASTPNTTGEGSPAILNPMPINTPCNRAVRLVPTTMARVTPLKLPEQPLLAHFVKGNQTARAQQSWSPRRAGKKTAETT